MMRLRDWWRLQRAPYRKTGKALRRLRKTAGVSQKLAAQVIGVDLLTLELWECGLQLPSANHAKWLLAFYATRIGRWDA